MKTTELVKEMISSIDREKMSYDEIEALAPVIRRAHVKGYDRMQNLLLNPKTGKWAIISDEEVNEISDLYELKKRGVLPQDSVLYKFCNWKF